MFKKVVAQGGLPLAVVEHFPAGHDNGVEEFFTGRLGAAAQHSGVAEKAVNLAQIHITLPKRICGSQVWVGEIEPGVHQKVFPEV